jgi:hypothetical protein
MAERWVTRAKSITSWTVEEQRKVKPVCLAAITSVWSPKIERACPEIARAVTWNLNDEKTKKNICSQ